MRKAIAANARQLKARRRLSAQNDLLQTLTCTSLCFSVLIAVESNRRFFKQQSAKKALFNFITDDEAGEWIWLSSPLWSSRNLASSSAWESAVPVASIFMSALRRVLKKQLYTPISKTSLMHVLCMHTSDK